MCYPVAGVAERVGVGVGDEAFGVVMVMVMAVSVVVVLLEGTDYRLQGVTQAWLLKTHSEEKFE